MKLLSTIALVAALAMISATGFAQTSTPGAAGTQPAARGAADKAAISKSCSEQADVKNLHGKERKKFRSACKRRGGKSS